MSMCGGPQELQPAQMLGHMPDSEEQQQQEQPAIELPEPLLQRILALAAEGADKRILYTAPLVCRAWCAAITPPRDFRIQQDLDTATPSSSSSACAWLRRNGRGGAVEALTLRQHYNTFYFYRYMGGLLGLDAGLLPRLRRLTLSVRTPRGAVLQVELCRKRAEAVAAHLPQLEVLAVESFMVQDGTAAALARLTNLRSLSLQHSGLNKQGMFVLAGALTQLTRLDLGWGFELSEFIHPLWLEPDSIAALAGLRQLADLSIGGRRPDAAAMRALATALTALTRLDVSHCELKPKELSPLSSMTRLRSLDLTYNWLNDDFFLALTAALTELTCLHIACYSNVLRGSLDELDELIPGQTTVGTAGMRALARLTALAQLDVSGIGIDAARAQRLAGTLPNLSRLSVYRCSLGPQGLASLAAGLTQLTHLDAGDNGIGGEATSAAAVQSLTQLQGLQHLGLASNRLHLEDCMPLTALTGLTCLNLAYNRLSWVELGALRKRLKL